LQTQLIHSRRIIYFVATDINIIGRNVPILAQQAFILDQIRRNQIDPDQKGPENLNWIAMPGTA